MRCQVRWTSKYSSADSLPRAMEERTSFRKISAPPPVRESSPAAFSSRNVSSTVFFASQARWRISMAVKHFSCRRWGGRSCCSSRPRGPAIRVERAQRLEHVRVIAERQRRMQSADDVQFRDAEFQCLTGLFDHLVRRQFESVLVALLARKRAELAGENAVIRVIDVAVENVAGAVADLLLSRQIRNRADGV